jgi:hypothetical protein
VTVGLDGLDHMHELTQPVTTRDQQDNRRIDTSDHTHTGGSVCVCVDGVRNGRRGWASFGQSHDGTALPSRGRGCYPRRYCSHTITNYILVLVCSSSRDESNLNVTLAEGGVGV